MRTIGATTGFTGAGAVNSSRVRLRHEAVPARPALRGGRRRVTSDEPVGDGKKGVDILIANDGASEQLKDVS